MAVSKIELSSLVVAGLAVSVSIAVAVYQSSQTRDALFESRVQARVSTCVSLGASYASQSWAYGPIPVDEYSKYGIPADTKYEKGGPNQLLAEFSGKSIALGRALQLCLVKQNSTADIKKCIVETVDALDEHKVDDTTPPDGKVDNIIC